MRGALLVAGSMLVATEAAAKYLPGHTPTPGWNFTYGAQYQAQQGPSVSLGFIRGITTDTAMTSGLLHQAQPGLGGGKASAGWAVAFLGEEPYLPAMGGLAVKASVLRTWGNPHGVQAGDTYAGPELDVNLLYAKLSGGVMWRLGGSEHRAIFVWGVGAGF